MIFDDGDNQLFLSLFGEIHMRQGGVFIIYGHNSSRGMTGFHFKGAENHKRKLTQI